MKRHHRRRTGAAKSKKKILFRILFVIIAAAVITALAILLGTHLKHKADSAESLLEELTSDFPSGGGREEIGLPDGVRSDGRARSITVRAADLDVVSLTESEVMEQLSSLSGPYNAVSIRVSRNGKLVYSSPAVAELTREPVPASAVDENEVGVSATLQKLSDVAKEARSEGFRVSMIYQSSPSVLGRDDDARFSEKIDLAVFGELYSAGANEIIIDGLLADDATLDSETLGLMIAYLSSVRTVTGDAAIGILLPVRVFSDTTTAAQIVSLSDYADLLAIGIPVEGAWDEESAYSSVETLCYQLQGNFATHDLRAIVMTGEESFALGAYRALGNLGVKNVQFTCFVQELKGVDVTDGSESETDADTDDEEKTNENAMTKDKYETSTDSPEP